MDVSVYRAVMQLRRGICALRARGAWRVRGRRLALATPATWLATTLASLATLEAVSRAARQRRWTLRVSEPGPDRQMLEGYEQR